MADRGGSPRDSGLGPSSFASRQRGTEQLIECRPRRALLLGDLPRRSNLSEDLALAEHGRVEAGRHLEEVGHRGGVMLAVEVRGEFVDAETAELAEQVADVAVGAVEQLGDHVHLGAIAGRQDDRFAHVVALSESADRLGEPIRRDRDALEEGQWTTAVVDADDEDGHSTDNPTPLHHVVARRAPHEVRKPARPLPGVVRSS